MINLLAINEQTYDFYRAQISQLIKSHKDGHITIEGYKKFVGIKKRDIVTEKATIVIALHNRKVVGMLACGGKGNDFAITVVHSNYRKHGLAKSMLKKTIEVCGSFYCEVASDNLPSLKTCFACDMVASDAFIRKNKVIMKMNTLNNVLK